MTQAKDLTVIEVESDNEEEQSSWAVVFDEGDPRSIVSIVPEALKREIRKLGSSNPEYMTMSEQDLRLMVNPNEEAEMLRISFWDEYQRAQDKRRKMKVRNIHSNIVGHNYFYEQFITKAKNLAWILSPPKDHILANKAYLNMAKGQLLEILKMPLFDSKGKLMVREAQVFLRAYELVENRVLGAVTQRIEQKTASVHMHGSMDPDPEEARKELEKLRAERGLIEREVGKT